MLPIRVLLYVRASIPTRLGVRSGELRAANGRPAISIASGSEGHRADVHAREAGDRRVAPSHGTRPTGVNRHGCIQRSAFPVGPTFVLHIQAVEP